MNNHLRHISEGALDDLRESISSNLSRYRGQGFNDFADEYKWNIELEIEVDNGLLSELDSTVQKNIVEIDLQNSKIVGRALANLTPSLANEELIWVRLSHVEAFEYSRSRWLPDSSDNVLEKNIATHLFAPTQTAIRDDHAISRLWWNYQVALSSMPEDVDLALKLIMKTADIRSNFVERIWMSSRRPIAGAILRAMDTNSEITATENNFRTFMKIINRHGGGIVFEALNDGEIDLFVEECCDQTINLADQTVQISQSNQDEKYVDGEI